MRHTHAHRSSTKTTLLLIIVVISLLAVMASPLQAQNNGQAHRQVTREINGVTVTYDVPPNLAPTEANFNRYKSDMLTILTTLRATLVQMNLTDALSKVDDAIAQAQGLQFSTLGENYPGFPDTTDLKNGVLAQKKLMDDAFAKGGARVAQFAPGDPFPPVEYASFCPLNPQPSEVAFTSGLLVTIAETVREIALDFCNQITEILGGGGNFRIACIITDVAYFTLKIIDYPIQACHSDTNLVAPGIIFKRLEYIKDLLNFSISNDNANKAMLSTQLTNAENHIVTNDNNNKASLSNQIGTFQTLSVRMSIEANLAEDPATFSGAGLFETPASQGGYLEVARQILIDTYNAHVAAAVAAGQPASNIYNPSTELSLGATLTAQGKYREAYYYYRKGYRSVVKYP